jgi:conjugal transfer pilus assembly protein TraF
MIKNLKLIIIITIIFSPICFAETPINAELLVSDIIQKKNLKNKRWNERHSEGWAWGNDPTIQEKKNKKLKVPKKPEIKTAQPVPSAPTYLFPPINKAIEDPQEEMKRVRNIIEKAYFRATLQPTRENIKKFMQIQHQMTEQSGVYAQVAKRTVWQTPELDYTLQRPTSQTALNVWSESYRQDRKKQLKIIAKEYGMYFFFSKNCPYCQRFAPMIKRFSQQYNFHVLPFTLDGGGLPDYPNPAYDLRLAKKLNVKSTPAIYLVNPSKGKVHPIAFSLISLLELEERIYKLLFTTPKQQIYTVNQKSGEK